MASYRDRALVGGSLVLGLWLVASGLTTSHAASFDCREATTAVEQVICKTPALSIADDALSALYTGLLPKLSQDGQSLLRRTQLQWLDNRTHCTGTEREIIGCLTSTYKFRSDHLRSISSHPPFFVLTDDQNEETNSGNCAGSQLHRSWPVIEGPDAARVDYANEAIQATCGVTDLTGQSDFLHCGISYLTERFLSLGYLTGRTPAESPGCHQNASYWSRELAFNLERRRPLAADDLFVPGSNWQDTILAECESMTPLRFPFERQQILDPSGWRLDTTGITVQCGDQESQSLGPPTAAVSWSTLKRFMAVDAPPR